MEYSYYVFSGVLSVGKRVWGAQIFLTLAAATNDVAIL